MLDTNTTLRISLAQYDIVWENKSENLNHVEQLVASLASQTDILVLPEMFSTGFSMNVGLLAETIHDTTMGYIKEWASKYNMSICGSFIAKEADKHYNRAFFIAPDNKEYYYDKRHLFRMGKETEVYTAGEKRLVFEHKGFRICLQVCYDLRFPVWARNVDNEYDLLIYVANWPKARAKVWNTLLTARAIENMCYVCGVNRIGHDGLEIDYDGHSKLIDARGTELSSIALNESKVETIRINKQELEEFRSKFPVWKDADRFELK